MIAMNRKHVKQERNKTLFNCIFLRNLLMDFEIYLILHNKKSTCKINLTLQVGRVSRDLTIYIHNLSKLSDEYMYKILVLRNGGFYIYFKISWELKTLSLYVNFTLFHFGFFHCKRSVLCNFFRNHVCEK